MTAAAAKAKGKSFFPNIFAMAALFLNRCQSAHGMLFPRR
jgi:hypothetical protein